MSQLNVGSMSLSHLSQSKLITKVEKLNIVQRRFAGLVWRSV